MCGKLDILTPQNVRKIATFDIFRREVETCVEHPDILNLTVMGNHTNMCGKPSYNHTVICGVPEILHPKNVWKIFTCVENHKFFVWKTSHFFVMSGIPVIDVWVSTHF